MKAVYKKAYSAFFLLSFGLWVIYRQIFTTRYESLIGDADGYFALFNYSLFILFISCALLIYRINKSTFLDISIILIFLLLTISTKQNGFLINFCLVFILVKYIRFDSILKTFLYLSLILYLLVYIGDLADLYPNLGNIELFRGDGTERHLMGFGFPTILPNYFYHFVLCYILLRNKKTRLIELVAIIAINYYLYYMTDTRAVYYLINLFCAVILLNKILKINYHSRFGIGFLFRFGTKYCYLICFLVAVYVQCFYNPEINWMRELDEALSGRLHLGYYGFSEYGIHLFGSNIEYVGYAKASANNPYFYIDSSFQQLLINYGIVPSILLGIGFTKLAKLIIERNDVYFGLVLVFLMGHSLTDPHLINPTYNPIFFALAYLASAKTREKLFLHLK